MAEVLVQVLTPLIDSRFRNGRITAPAAFQPNTRRFAATYTAPDTPRASRAESVDAALRDQLPDEEEDQRAADHDQRVRLRADAAEQEGREENPRGTSRAL